MQTQIRSELSGMSFQDLMKLKDKLGTKTYNEAIFGESKHGKKKVKTEYKRDNKNRPREASSKKPVGQIKIDKKHAKVAETSNRPRDPRFDPNCGDFDSTAFKERYDFVSEIKSKELDELKLKLKKTRDETEVANIKFLIQRLENQQRENTKRKDKEASQKEERDEIKKARLEGRTPEYINKSERKARDLVKKYLELKETGKLNKHLEKRRKKNTAKDRKKFSFD